MILLNFGHPLTETQKTETEKLLGTGIDRVIETHSQFDAETPFSGQARELVNRVGLSGKEWQTEALLVNLPSLSVIAGLVTAELHGRCGYFPAVLRLKSVPGTPPRFEVAEILNLQAQRDSARTLRSE